MAAGVSARSRAAGRRTHVIGVVERWEGVHAPRGEGERRGGDAGGGAGSAGGGAGEGGEDGHGGRRGTRRVSRAKVGEDDKYAAHDVINGAHVDASSRDFGLGSFVAADLGHSRTSTPHG